MNKSMGRGKMAKVLLAAGFMVLFAGNAFALTLNFSSIVGADVTFTGTGDTFAFNPEAGGFDFQITNSTGVTDGDTVGLYGNIEGDFIIGAITTIATVPYLIQSAPVTGSGTFSITDENNIDFLATLNWLTIGSIYGSGGHLNITAAANLTSVSYAGSNADLQQLLNTVVISYQFIPPKSLDILTKDGEVVSTSYSGSVSTPVPEPGSLLLIGTGLMGLGLIRRRKQAR